MTVSKTLSILALASLLGANIASAQVAPGCTPPNQYLENGTCVPYYPYPGHGQVVNGQQVGSGAVLGASTSQSNLPGGSGTLDLSTSVNAANQQRVNIMISDSAFTPAVVTVSPGTTVTWTNNGSSSHVVNVTTSVFGGSANSGLILPGGTYSRAFTDAGTYYYVDSTNPNAITNNGTVNPGVMAGAVIVTSGNGSVLGASTSQPNLPNTGTTSSASSGNAATTVNAVNSGQRVVQVGVFDNFFDPHNVVIPTGGTVTWTNRGTTTHSIQADNGTFLSTMAPGGTYSHIFNTPGTYLYYDTANGGPNGTGMFGVVVVQNPTSSGGSVLGASTGNPNLPNTGAGGYAGMNALVMGLAGFAMLLGTYLLVRRRYAAV